MADDEEEAANWSEQVILESFEQAQDELDEYEALLQMAAMNNENPFTHDEVQAQKVWLHIATMRCFRKLPRVAIREKMSPYWDDAIIYDDGQRQIIGLKSLEQFQGAVYSDTETKRVRHKGKVTTKNWNAQLMPGQAYRRTLHLFQEILERLGYRESPDPPKTVSVMDANGGEENATNQGVSDD